MIDREGSQYTMYGLRLREIREHHGLTQEQLARRLKVSARVVSRWERGNTKRDMQLRFLNWKRVARLFNVHPAAVFDLPGVPIRRPQGTRIKRQGEITIYQPVSLAEARAMLQCSLRELTGLIKRGEIKTVAVTMCKAKSLYRYIAKRAGYSNGA